MKKALVIILLLASITLHTSLKASTPSPVRTSPTSETAPFGSISSGSSFDVYELTKAAMVVTFYQLEQLTGNVFRDFFRTLKQQHDLALSVIRKIAQ